MSGEILGNVFRHSKQKATKRLMMVILAEYATPEGVAYPSIETLAAYANIEQRNASLHINALVEAGELYAHRRPGLHNVYIVLPGLTEADRARAVKYINRKYPADMLLTVNDLPPMISTGDTPDDSITPDDFVMGTHPPTIPSGVPPMISTGEPLTIPSSPPDDSVRRSKDSVVGDQDSSDIQDIQQQGAPPPRDPELVERALFEEHRIQEAIWSSWMRHDAVTVVAAILHATTATGVQNPIGLMRAMLEHGTASPGAEYVRAAEERLGRVWIAGGARYTDDELDALQAANWDPRALKPGWNGNGHKEQAP